MYIYKSRYVHILHIIAIKKYSYYTLNKTQPDILARPSSRCKLTYETVPISTFNQDDAMGPHFGHSTILNVWESIGKNMLSIIVHWSWERVCVNLIFRPDLAVDVN